MISLLVPEQENVSKMEFNYLWGWSFWVHRTMEMEELSVPGGRLDITLILKEQS